MKRKRKFSFDEIYVWDTLKARGEVNQAVRIAERFGPMDHLDLVEANVFLADETPCAVGLSDEGGRLSCALLLNARRKEFFRSFPTSRRAQRLLWLLDSMLESIQIRENYEAGDSPAVQFAYSPSPPVALASINVAARFFYIRQRRIDQAIKENISGADGRPMTLARMLDGDDSPTSVQRQLREKVTELPDKVRSLTTPVVEGRNRDVMDVWVRCASLVGETVGLLVQTAAAYDSTGEWASIQRRLDDSTEFAAYYGPSWPTLHADWVSAAARTRPENRLPSPDVMDALRSIFERLGIHVLDEPKGMTLVEFSRLEAAA